MTKDLMCGGKTKFKYAREARASMKHAIENGSAGWRKPRIYKCPHCNHWHWGHRYVERNNHD